MKPLYFLFLICLLGSNASYAEPCDFYLQKAQQIGCDDNNFLVKFGHHYCEKFLTTELKYSKQGQQVLDKIRPCLIQHIDRDNLSCDNAEEIALQAHSACYIQNGFCNLDPQDLLLLYWTVRTEISNPQVIETQGYILQQCGFATLD